MPEITPPVVVNRANMERFTTALRSGNYPQATGCLRTRSGWCCLGVAANEYKLATGRGRWRRPRTPGHEGYTFTDADGNQEFSVLPRVVMTWLGLDSTNPSLRDGLEEPDDPADRDEDYDDAYETCAAGLNDTGWTFTQIADAFEARYLNQEAGSDPA